MNRTDTKDLLGNLIYKPEVLPEIHSKVTRLQDKCVVCGKVAKERERKLVKTSEGYKYVITLECRHIYLINADSQSPFELLTIDASPNCKHKWGTGKYYTYCSECPARRLYPYQVEGARALEKANGRLAIFDEMGLGKTIQALAYLKYHDADAFPYLWVTKSSIKFQHAREIIRVLGDMYFPQVIMTGKDPFIDGMKGYLASYDIFRRKDLADFDKLGIKTLILDECQAIKNPDSTRTQCIRKVAKSIPKIIPLSGTFWKNRGSEAFVALNMLAPTRFWSFEAFKRQHVSYYYQGDKQKEGGLRKGFIKEISDIAIRRERAEVMPELPLINRTKLTCEMPESYRKVYNEEADKIAAIVNEAVIGGEENTFATNAAINTALLVMRQIVGLAKVPATVEYVKEFLEETDRNIAVFLHHKKCGELIFEQLKAYCAEEGLPEPLVITSALDPIARTQVCDKFNSNKYRVLVASSLASGEGLNLQYHCADLVQHERQWNPPNEEQVEGRFIRIGQQAESVNAVYVHGADTCDTDLDAIVEQKRIQFHNSMNKGEMAVWHEESLKGEVIRKIVEAANRRKGK